MSLAKDAINKMKSVNESMNKNKINEGISAESIKELEGFDENTTNFKIVDKTKDEQSRDDNVWDVHYTYKDSRSKSDTEKSGSVKVKIEDGKVEKY